MGQTVWDAALGSLITDERLKEGYAYWCRKAPGAKLPRRADIDPSEIPHLLPHIRIVDVVEHRRFRYRLVGTETRQQHKTDPTGRFLDTLAPFRAAHHRSLCRMCLRSPTDLRRARVRSAKWPRHLSALQSALHASVRGRRCGESGSSVPRARRSCVAATWARSVGTALPLDRARASLTGDGIAAQPKRK